MKKVSSNMRFIVLLILSLFFSLTSFSQSDSIIVVNTKWDIKEIAPGIKLKQHWFNNSLFHSNQNINILEVKLNRRNEIDLAVEPHKLKGTSKFGIENNALAAINGTFFDMKNGGSVDYIRVGGITINENRLQVNNTRAIHQRAAIVISKKHKIKILQWDGSKDWEKNISGEDIMVTGPLLVKNRKTLNLDSSAIFLTRNPRTALAIKGHKVFLITIDGRRDKAAGMNLFELGKVLKWIKADEAINLDGGGSTTLWIYKQPYGGIINYPSDNKKWETEKNFKAGTDLDNYAADKTKWDHTGERPVANVILIKRKR